jgi:hypothetical protein
LPGDPLGAGIGVNVNPAPIPPVSVTVCGDAGDVALSMITSVALCSVVTVGLNVTVIMQLESFPTLGRQPLVCVKSVALAGVMVMLVTLSPMLTLAERVTVMLGDIPTGTGPKLRLVVERPAVTLAPLPDSDTVCGLLEALFMTVSVALSVLSGGVGAKVSVIVQEIPAASVAGEAGQLFDCLKSAASVPEIPNAPVAANVSGPGPELVSMMVCMLGVPTATVPGKVKLVCSVTRGAGRFTTSVMVAIWLRVALVPVIVSV